MKIISNKFELILYLKNTIGVSKQISVLIQKFLENAIEVDVDAISDGQEVFIGGILEHVEPAGIHSGDSACSFPPFSLSSKQIRQIKAQVLLIIQALQMTGPINIQFAIQGLDLYVLEVNLRISRTVPFISRARGIPLAQVAMRCLIGKTLREQGISCDDVSFCFFSVKHPVFSFDKFPGSNTTLGPEMKSTGEVMGIGATFEQAYQKALMGASGSCDQITQGALYSLQEWLRGEGSK
jgi:carbamoyl-phosphate synthase large subunit